MHDGKIYKFSEFRLIPDDSLLTRDGDPIPLPPKAFGTLLLLVEKAGHLVTKSELIEKVWDNAFVEEAAVSKCVWTIRNALGQSSKDQQQFIQTIPKRGYKFVSPVSVAVGPSDAPAAANRNHHSPLAYEDAIVPAGAQSTETSFNRSTRTFAALTTFAILAVLLAAAYTIFSHRSLTADGQQQTIAILPVRPVNTETNDRSFELAIADALIVKLGASKSLAVRPLQSVQSYSDKEVNPIDAGKEQEVHYVLSSNYQIADGKIRVTSQLLNVSSGLVEDTFKVEKSLGDFFAVQDAVADDLGGKLLARFSLAPSVTKNVGTTNEEAYRLYLQAMYLSTQRRPDSMAKSVEVFEQVVKLDPNYAQAWAGKAYAHTLSTMTLSGIDPKEAFPKALEAIQRALALDPNLPEAYSALCQLKIISDYDFVGAEPFCKRGVELGPNSTRAHQAYAYLLSSRGQGEEAMFEMKTALDLDPTSYENHRFYANSLYYARRYDEAVERYKRLIDLDPDASASYNWLVRALEAQGKESEAYDWFIKSLSTRKDSEAAIQRYSAAYRTSGWSGVLAERIREAEKGKSPNGSFRIAGFYAKLGNKDKALEYLEKAYQDHEGQFGSLAVEPQLDSLRDDPRFQNLATRLHLK